MRRTTLPAIALLALGSALGGPPAAHGQSGGPYALTWNSITGGGTESIERATGYRLTGAVGQPGTGTLSGGSYTLTGGFWTGGGGTNVGVEDERVDPVSAFRVHPSVPNPFRDQATIAFDLPEERRVEMSVYDLRGERVRLLMDQTMPAGRHRLTWAGIGDDGRRLPPGVYWVKTRAGDRGDVRKIVLVK
jgi:hypothetical protein